jgi:GNAT superfamily N-acetyltransferase
MALLGACSVLEGEARVEPFDKTSAASPCGVMISPLADVPDAIPLLARWLYDEWHGFDGRSTERIEAQLSENLNRDDVPITFVAQSDAQLLGTISLDVSDLPPFDSLSPWVASFYVLPAARGAGIGRALLRHAQQFAASRGFSPLYLWTPGSTRLYERCGWAVFERSTYHTKPITLLRFCQESRDA